MIPISSLKAKAQALVSAGTLTALATIATTASANPLNLSFAAQGLYDNSGFFTGNLVPIVNGGSGAIPSGFKLFGEGSLQDSDFYRLNDEAELEPIFDGDGLGFLWGGDVAGSINPGDIFNIDIDLSYSFTHTPAHMYDNPNVFAYAQFGIFDNYGDTEPFVDYFSGGRGRSTDYYSDSVSMPGLYDVSGNMQLEIYEGDFTYENPTNWYLILYVSWEHENDSGNYEAPFPKLNGDTLNVTIPQNSIDLTYEPALGVIPEPANMALLMPLAICGILATRRRNRAS